MIRKLNQNNIMAEENITNNVESVKVENTEPSHEVTLFAEPIFHIRNFTVTNSLINSWVAVFILVVLFILAGKKITKVPRGLQNIFELLLEEALKLSDSITGNRKKTEKFLPIVLTLFLFILANNWLGLLPGIGTIGFNERQGGHEVFVPIFRGATADLNTTFALAIFAVVMSHIFGVLLIGFWKHFNKFINIDTILSIPRNAKKELIAIFLNPIKAFISLVELLGEFAKVASLSFRLFGNIFAGEVLLASMMAIFGYFLPIPFIFLEIVVGIIQAFIFSMLTLVFMSMAATAEEH
jgi:F-type H+-transporting ATPase subunit a